MYESIDNHTVPCDLYERENIKWHMCMKVWIAAFCYMHNMFMKVLIATFYLCTLWFIREDKYQIEHIYESMDFVICTMLCESIKSYVLHVLENVD